MPRVKDLSKLSEEEKKKFLARRAAKRKYYLKNRAKYLEEANKKYSKNPKIFIERAKIHYQKNKKKILEKMAKDRETVLKFIKENQKEFDKFKKNENN